MPLSALVRASLACLLVSSGSAAAATIELRIAIQAPSVSSTMKALDKAASDVVGKTGGRVSIKFYAGGQGGDERDVVRKIGLGQLDGAMLTSVGLAMIDGSIDLLQAPRLFRSVEELDDVADKMWPSMQKKFAAKGYTLAGRGDVGWVYVVSKNEMKSLADLKAAKACLLGGDPAMTALYKRLGVPGVPLGPSEVAAAFTAGRIDACYASPAEVIALEWQPKVKFLLDTPLVFAISAIVVSNSALAKMSAADGQTVAGIFDSVQKALRKQMRKDNDSARQQMARKGVKITAASAALAADLDKAAGQARSDLVGKSFGSEDLALAVKNRDDFRAKRPGP